jgi:hypothetical protein
MSKKAERIKRVYEAIRAAAIPNPNGDNRSVNYYASVGIDAFDHDPPSKVDFTKERPFLVDRLLWKAAEDAVAALNPGRSSES